MIFKRMRELAIEKALKGELIENNKSDFASDKSDCLNIDQQIDTKWQWFKLPELVSFKIGKTPYRGNINYWKGDVPWVAIADITASNGHISNTAECITELAKEECFKNNIAKAGSLLMSFKLSIGKMAILDIDAAHNEAIISMTVNNNSEITKKFLFYFLPYFAQKASKVNAVKGPTLNKTKLLNLRIACPEIREQELIVRKLDIVFAEIYRAEKAYEELQSLAKVLRGQILQKAIQGKLVPQLPEDGVVEQIGKAPAEVPFDIPTSWKWIKIKDVFSMQAGKFIKASEIKEVGAYPCYGGNGLRGFVDNSNRKGRFPIIGRQGALCGNIHVVDGEFYATEHAVVVNCGSYGDPDCVGLFLEQMNLNQYATATAQPGLAVKKIEVLPFPLPPLAEQKRIVAKVKALFEQIDLMTK